MEGRQHLRTGDKCVCRLRFVRHPEYVRKDARVVFREGRTKAVGTVHRLAFRGAHCEPR